MVSDPGLGGVGLCLANESVYVDATHGSVRLSLGPTVGVGPGSDPITRSGSSWCDFVERRTLGVGWSDNHAWLGPTVVITA